MSTVVNKHTVILDVDPLPGKRRIDAHAPPRRWIAKEIVVTTSVVIIHYYLYSATLNIQMNRSKKNKRTFGLYILIIASLLIAWSGGLRVYKTFANAKLINAIDLQAYTPFLVASGIAYGLLGLSAALALFLRWQWAPWYAPLAWFLTTLLYWVEHLLLTLSPAANVNIPFEILLDVFMFLAALFILTLPRQQRFFNVTLNNPFNKKG